VSRRRRLGGHAPTLLSAVRNVSRAKLRSALAAAAIFVGVVAIAVVGAGGEAFKQSQLDSVESQGATYVFVSPGPDSESRAFTREDLVAIRETVGPTGVLATTSRDADWRRRGPDRTVSVTYVGSAASLRRVYDVERGTVPRNWRRQLVVSGEFAADHGVAPGDRLWLDRGGDGGRSYRVAAVLAESGGFGGGEVYLPVTALDDREFTQVRVLTGSADDAEATATLLREEFNDRRDRLLVFELTSLLRLFTRVVNGINAFLVGVGAVSMVVAGVSITNTMLMAVIRRREEIGVLRAVGYRRVDVVRILLAEAALLGAAGAAAGLLVGTPVVMVANAVFLGDPLAFSGTAVGYLAGAAAFGVGVSLLAGAYPAWRAANERPVDALRG
jgi:putative ABC transport system permease protein